MQYTKLEGIDKEISRLIYGCGNDVLRGTDPEAAAECLDAACEYGFCAFDSAYTYEASEKNIGKWMQKTRRLGSLDIILLIIMKKQ